MPRPNEATEITEQPGCARWRLPPVPDEAINPWVSHSYSRPSFGVHCRAS
jgi:hypothetical protein